MVTGIIRREHIIISISSFSAKHQVAGEHGVLGFSFGFGLLWGFLGRAARARL